MSSSGTRSSGVPWTVTPEWLPQVAGRVNERHRPAGRFKTNIEPDLLRGEYRDPRTGKITLREYVTRDWLPHQTFSASSREVTERRLRLHVLPVLGDTMITHITPTVVKSWVGRLDGSPSTARQLLALLSSILGAAIDDGLIVRNPCRARSVRAPRAERREIRPWTADQVAQARAGLAPRWQAMADCGAGMGLRIGEACGLAVEDVDFLRRRVHVRRQVQRIGGRAVLARPKGGKERHVPLADSAAVAPSEHIRQFPPAAVTMPWQVPAGKPVTAGLLFTMPGGKAIGPNDWNTHGTGRCGRPRAGPPGTPGSTSYGTTTPPPCWPVAWTCGPWPMRSATATRGSPCGFTRT
jgi:integrase